MGPITYDETPEFVRDVKQLLKRFRSLREDIEVAKRAAIELFHGNPRIDYNSIEEIPGHCTDAIRCCKVKKFACRALKGRGVMSGIRMTYAFHVAERRVAFIQMYFKGDEDMEDKQRLKDYIVGTR